jgi:RHS repeat-associated protein
MCRLSPLVKVRQHKRTQSLSTILFLLLSPVVCMGQDPGNPMDPSDSQYYDSFQVDSVNLQNLSIGISLPVRNKAGAFPFSYSLQGNSSCVTVVGGSVGHHAIECGINPNKWYGFLSPQLPYSNWTLLGVTNFNQEYGTGNAFPGWTAHHTTSTSGTCATDGKSFTKYSGFYLTSPDFTTYYMPGGYTIAGSACAVSFSAYTLSGGIHAVISGGSAAVSLTLPNGHTISPANSLPIRETDAFGNVIQFDSNTNVYTDTLNTTALTVVPFGKFTGSGGSYAWRDATGATQQIKEITSPATIKTAFNCGFAIDNLTQSGAALSEVDYPDGNNVYFTYEPITGGITGRLQSIQLRKSGTISYSYGPINDCTGFIPTTLSRTTREGTTTYTFAVFQASVGYGTTTTVLDPGKNKAVYTFIGTDLHGLPRMGSPVELTQVQKWQNVGTVASPAYASLSTVLICYNGNTSNCANTDPPYPVTTKDVYRTIGTMATSSRVKTTYDTYGNVTSVAKYDFGATSPTTTTTTYYGYWGGTLPCAAIGSGIVNLPCDVVNTDNAGHTLSEARFGYDINGFNTARDVWTGSTWLHTAIGDTPNGTAQFLIDPNNAYTSFNYAPTGSGGCNGLFETSRSTTVSSGDVLTTSKAWNCDVALVTSTTDANGNGTSTLYNDPLSRVSSFTDESGFTTTTSYGKTTLTTSNSFGSSISNVTTTTDDFGKRILTQKKQGPSSANYDTTSYAYGFNGPNRQTSTSTPCVQTLGQGCGSYFAVTTLDPLGRTMQTTDASGNGTVSHTFSNNDTGVTVSPAPAGENPKSVHTESDGLGRTVSTCVILSSGGTPCGQGMSGSGILSTSAYSFASGSTTVAVTRGLQTRTTVSDATGRVTSANTPEAGMTQYLYDSAGADACSASSRNSKGDLLRTTDANGNYVCSTYDSLHRVTDQGNNLQNSTNPCRRFRYDNSTGVLGTIPVGITVSNALGKLVEAETDTCASPVSQSSIITDEWFSYDKNGRITDIWESTPHSGGYYHTAVTYFPNGVVSSLSGIPGFATYTYGVDGEGRASTAIQGTTTIINGTTFDASSHPLTVNIYTLGDNDTYTYDPATGRMKSYAFSVNGVSDTGRLTWNSNGALQQLAIVDGFNSGGTQTCNFGYDDAARLTTDNCGSIWSQTFNYDQYDNLTKSGSITWNPGYNSANNRYLSIGATYDPDGHLTYDSFNSYTWDVYGKMFSQRSGNGPVVCGMSGICMTYDANGRAVERNNTGVYSEILYSPIGKAAIMSGASTVTRSYIPLPGGVSLTTIGGGKQVEHRDWLGTARLSTGLANRALIYDRAFAPYGEMYANFGSTSYVDFTGDKQDLVPGAGLFDTPNREEAPNQGRWISPDPTGKGSNLYAYSTNPNSNTDPLGLATTWYFRHTNKAFCNAACGPDGDMNLLFSWGVGTPQEDGPDHWNGLEQLMNNINHLVFGIVFLPEIQMIDMAMLHWDLYQPIIDRADPACPMCSTSTVTVGWFKNTWLNQAGHIGIGVDDNSLFGQNPASDVQFVTSLFLNNLGCKAMGCNPWVVTVVPGAILPEDPNRIPVESWTHGISFDQAVSIQTGILLSSEQPPNYSIMGPAPACDCGTWAQQMLTFGGIDSGPPAWKPQTLLQQLYQYDPPAQW